MKSGCYTFRDYLTLMEASKQPPVNPYEKDRKQLQRIEPFVEMLKDKRFEIGAEIGVWRGEFSESILKRWDGVLLLVDSWKPKEGYEHKKKEHEENKAETVARTEKFNRSVIMHMDSKEASKQISDGRLDFVFIDGDHSYEGVQNDLKLWYPKIRSGGLFCGHDYLDGFNGETQFGVKSAVDEFAKKLKMKPFIFGEKKYPCWAWFKV